MPSFMTIVENTSPILDYSTQWRAGTSETDSSMDQYTENTFTLTQTQGSTMSFQFFGSYIGLFGAKRSNHGNYVVQLDGVSSPTFNGQSNISEFNQTLYSSNVNLGSHEIIITTEDSNFLDIDYVAFQTSVGTDDEDLIVNTYQDSHPAFNYTPASAWTIPSMVGTFSGGSGHATTAGSAQVTMTFQVGNAIALYGPVGPNSTTAYSVQVDNGTVSISNAHQSSYRSQQILFYAGDLGTGQHLLKVEIGTGPGEFAIDFANVYTSPSLGGSYLTATTVNTTTTGTTTPSSSTSLHGSHIPVGIIAALAIVGALAILSSILCIYLLWRLRRRYTSLSEEKMSERIVIDPVTMPARVEEHPAVMPFQAGAFSHETSAASAASLPSTARISGLIQGSSNLLTVSNPTVSTPTNPQQDSKNITLVYQWPLETQSRATPQSPPEYSC